MCCACGGGKIEEEPDDDATPPACLDTNNGATDSYGAGCYAFYGIHVDECGTTDDNDFKAFEMCCACGGGKPNPDVQNTLVQLLK